MGAGVSQHPMTTTATRSAQQTYPASQEQRLLLTGILWHQFKAIQTTLETVLGVRLAYFHGNLEVMTISPEHEDLKSLIGSLVEIYLIAAGLRYYRRGGLTLRQEPDVEMMPDESFNLGSKKSIPDLAIEVIVTSDGIDKLVGYKTLQVPEVWFLKDGNLLIYGLQAEQYVASRHSNLLPDLDVALLTQCLAMPDAYDAIAAFRTGIQSRS